jgi:hypothetical protein
MQSQLTYLKQHWLITFLPPKSTFTAKEADKYDRGKTLLASFKEESREIRDTV